jgi:predicted transposase YbfD/YdcC
MGLSRVQIVTGAVPAMSSLPIRVPESHRTGAAAAVVSVVAGGVPSGLLEALGAVDDPRRRRGRRHSFTAVLAAGVCAVLTGARSYAAIAEWIADAGMTQRGKLGLTRADAPDLTTIWRLLIAVDPRQLDRAIGAWLAGLLARRPCRGRRRVVAIDGKSIRGARRRGRGQDEERAPHLMGCIDHASGVVLAQVAVGSKTNEIPMFSVTLDQIEDLDGVLVTADALHAQREHATYLRGRHAHYLITIKANQPSLYRQLKALPWKDIPLAHASREKGHGRIAERRLKVVSVPAGIAFPDAQQVLQITRRTHRKPSKTKTTKTRKTTRKKTTTPARQARRTNPDAKRWQSETVYAITSLPTHQASPAELAAWVQDHWKIENQLHWVRDVTFGEDYSQAHTGNGPHIMASLRNLSISILRLDGHTNIAATTRHIARKPDRPLAMINRVAGET